MAKKETKKAVATLSIVEASKMTVEQRKEISLWLRRCSTALTREGSNYADKFTAKYIPQ